MSMRPADLLIAGIGFVGSYVLAEAVDAGLVCSGVDLCPTDLASELGAGLDTEVRSADLRDPDAMNRILHDSPPRGLVITSRLGAHAAGLASLRNLINNAAAVGVSQIILVSSLAVYGEATVTGGLRETSQPVRPSSYGLSKLEEEQVASAASEQAGVSCLILRSTGMFGRRPAALANDRSAGAIDRVIRQYCAGERPVLQVENMLDQYLYARELGAIVVAALMQPPGFEVMNVGPGGVLGPEQVCEVLESVFGVNVTLRRRKLTGKAIQALNVDRLNEWFPQRARARSDFTAGIVSSMRDFGIRTHRSGV